MATFNTTDPKPGYVYDSAIDTWFPLVGIAPGSSVYRWRFTAVGAETSVSGLDDLGATLSYNAGTEQVYLNGVLLVRTEDYTATNGTSVTALNALAASDVIEVISFNATNIQITDALLETDINAKGDLIVGAAVDTAAILASGTNGQVLKVNTSTATGLEWGTVDADIEGVTAGTGISGGGTSGTVTITNSMATAIDAKGDLVAGTGADAFAKLSVGTNGQVLTAASGETTGLSWATPAAGGMTLLSTTTLSGASTTISSISGAYTNLFVYVYGVNAEGTFRVAPNGTTNIVDFMASTGSVDGGTFSMRGFQDNYLNLSTYTGNDALHSGATQNSWSLEISNYSQTNGFKPVIYYGQWRTASGDGNKVSGSGAGGIKTTSAVSSLVFSTSSGSFSAGTVLVYGVK